MRGCECWVWKLDKTLTGQIYFGEGSFGGLRGLRVRALGGSECGILILRVWDLRGSTEEEALAVWLRSEVAEVKGGTRQRNSERFPSGEIRGG